VRDPLSEQYYTRDGKSAGWTTADLLAGVVVALEPRSDLFLLVSPAEENLTVDPSRLMYSREFDVLPGHAAASAQAGPIKGKAFCLPKDGWHFKMDEKDVGVEAQWFLPTAPLEGWEPIEIERFWGGQGGVGPGWYRADVNIPALPEGPGVYLHFGAVDEELMLWIDGQFAGEHNLGPEGWDQPFAMDVTGKLTAGKHHLAMRVYNSAAAGGIWKPVSILNGPSMEGATNRSEGPGPSDRLVYTATEQIATEQMAFEGGCGVGAIIDNTIRTMDRNGANQLRVRQLHGHLWSPRYSPDGQRIAFVHDAGGRGQIFVMNADGSDAVNISNNAFCDRSPVWSPDGARIAFRSEREGDWDVYVMNADGTDQRRLAGNVGLDRAPAWSPDGTRLAWESHVSGLPNIWICDANGQNSRPVIAPAPAQPPDGGTTNLKIQQVRAWLDPVEIVDVEPAFPDHTFYLTDPVWSPDSQRIAAVGVGDSSGSMVVVLEADGSRMRQIIPWIAGPGHLTWSPDGTRLAGTLRTAPQETERSGLFIVNADGTNNYRWLVDVTPQGPRLGGALRMGLMTWYSHGSAQPRRVVKTFGALAWSPDGTTLAFSSDMDPSGAFYVYTISPDGGEPQRLDGTMSAWPQEIMWKPR
jgi:Tol biopolymer transport system component